MAGEKSKKAFEKTEREMFSAAVHLLDNGDCINAGDTALFDGFMVPLEDYQIFAECLRVYRSGRDTALVPHFLPEEVTGILQNDR